jgi:hypothetical protein
MGKSWIHGEAFAGAAAAGDHAEDMLVACCLAAAAQGDVSAYFDLGVA